MLCWSSFDKAHICSIDAIHEAKAQMGGLNVVCNNAGVGSYTVTDERNRFDEIISVNLVSTSLCLSISIF